LAATGGALGLAVLVLAVLTYLAFAARTAAFEGGEDGDGLEGAVSKVAQLMAKRPYPSVENKKQIDANRQVVENWSAAVRKEVSRGDWCAVAGCTPAQFKEQIATDVKGILALKGPLNEPIVKSDFGFGPFKDYLADKMPSVDQLPKLQRQWYDLTSLVGLLATNGVSQITDMQVVDRAAEAAKAEQGKGDKGKKSKAKAKGKKNAKEKGVREPSVETYHLSFVATPDVFTEVVRTLSFQDRFTVVENFGFVRQRDAITEALGGGEKKEGPVTTGGRRGRRRAAQEAVNAEEKEGEKKNAVVFDPATDSAVKVELTVSVYDFRSLEEEEEGVSK